jgi:hypothetical protein
VVTGSNVDPKTARTTVEQWCTTWLEGYATCRPSTVRQARVHVAQILIAFGPMPLAEVRPSQVRLWTAKVKAEGLGGSQVYALHARLSLGMSDAVHDAFPAHLAPAVLLGAFVASGRPRRSGSGFLMSTSCAAS